jgi:hypothetical protein
MAESVIVNQKIGPSGFENSQGAKYEVQRTHNFEIRIHDIGNTEEEIALAIEQGFLPNITIDPIELPKGNRTVKVAGRPTFDNGSITVKDWIGVDMEKLIYDWMKKVYDPDTDKVGFASDYKKPATIIELSPDGSIERHWDLEGVWPTSVNFGTLDNGSADKKTIEIQLAYDKISLGQRK